MGTTNPQDRLNRLFADSPLPPAPTPGQLHFSERELQEKNAEVEKPLPIGSTAEYPRQIKSPQSTESQRARDILTSSDEDDYVSAFKKKPSMKTPIKAKPPKSQTIIKHNYFGHPKNATVEPEGSIQYLAKGKWSNSNLKHDDAVTGQSDSDDDQLPTASDQGNPATGHFCQFNLVAKFPYKYMDGWFLGSFIRSSFRRLAEQG